MTQKLNILKRKVLIIISVLLLMIFMNFELNI